MTIMTMSLKLSLQMMIMMKNNKKTKDAHKKRNATPWRMTFRNTFNTSKTKGEDTFNRGSQYLLHCCGKKHTKTTSHPTRFWQTRTKVAF